MLAVLRHGLAGMTAALRAEAQPAVDLLGITIPEVPAEIPVIHFREALKVGGALPDEPDLAPAHERAIGRWAAETHGSDFIAVRDRAGALDQPPDPGREHPRGDAVPQGPAPPDALGPDGGRPRRGGGSRVDAEASGYLVGPPVFKTGERCAAALAGSIPVRLR